MTTAALAGSAGQAVFGSLGALQESRRAEEERRQNARIAERNAEQEALVLDREAAVLDVEAAQEIALRELETETARKIASRLQAERRAAIGAAGLEFTGAPLIAAVDEARELELDIQLLQFASESREAALRDDAAMARFEAASVRESGRFTGGSLRREARMIARERPLVIAAAAVGSSSGLGRSLTTSGVIPVRGERRTTTFRTSSGNQEVLLN